MAGRNLRERGSGQDDRDERPERSDPRPPPIARVDTNVAPSDRSRMHCSKLECTPSAERALALVARGRLLAQRRMRCGQAGDRDSEGRAGDVVEAHVVAELDAVRVAAVLAADPDLEARARGAAPLDGPLHQAADTLGVDRHEWINRQDLALDVLRQELAR